VQATRADFTLNQNQLENISTAFQQLGCNLGANVPRGTQARFSQSANP
jgi:hypothetical protein